MSLLEYGKNPSYILDFDLENRPLSYLGMDFTTSEVTAIACKWTCDKDQHTVWLLGEDDPQRMLEQFAEMYTAADMVTGHYIRNHDLPILQGAMAEYDLPPLPRRMSEDTKNDLIGFKGISKSQENLAAMFGLEAEKIQMNQVKWRDANRLTRSGLTLTEKRVVGDIYQHEQLRLALRERGLLKSAKPWG
jgi:hypothetical protein